MVIIDLAMIMVIKPSVVVHDCNPCIQEAETGVSPGLHNEFKDNLGKTWFPNNILSLV